MVVLSLRDRRGLGLILVLLVVSLYLFLYRPSLPPFDQFDVSQASNLDLETPAPTPRMYWRGVPPETTTWHKVAGFTVFKNLYIYNYTIYVVTTDPHSVPKARWMISKGLTLIRKQDNEPDESTLSIITPLEAKALFGDFASLMQGVTFMQTDGTQFLGHMYHFVVEIFALWHWRLYTSPELDHLFPYPRALPSRYVFPNCPMEKFLDHAGMNHWVLRASLPSASLEFKEDWDVRNDQMRPYLLESVILGDRAAWHRVGTWKRPPAKFPVAIREDFWRPMRELVTEFAFGKEKELAPTRPVITYISRQMTSRRLKESDHERLVAALKDMAERENYELHILLMERLDKSDQIRLLSRTTVLLAVHGNGLSGQLWLKPGPRTTVIEIFFTGGFLFDYEYTARLLGIKHYGVWHDKFFTAPELPDDTKPEGFHGSSITVDATAVTSLIYRRLTLANPDEA